MRIMPQTITIAAAPSVPSHQIRLYVLPAWGGASGVERDCTGEGVLNDAVMTGSGVLRVFHFRQ